MEKLFLLGTPTLLQAYLYPALFFQAKDGTRLRAVGDIHGRNSKYDILRKDDTYYFHGSYAEKALHGIIGKINPGPKKIGNEQFPSERDFVNTIKDVPNGLVLQHRMLRNSRAVLSEGKICDTQFNFALVLNEAIRKTHFGTYGTVTDGRFGPLRLDFTVTVENNISVEDFSEHRAINFKGRLANATQQKQSDFEVSATLLKTTPCESSRSEIPLLVDFRAKYPNLSEDWLIINGSIKEHLTLERISPKTSSISAA